MATRPIQWLQDLFWQIIAPEKCQKVEISVKVLENGGQVAY